MKSNNKLLLMIGIIFFLIFLIYLSSSFYQVLVLSIIIAYFVHPLKKKLLKKIKSTNIASLIALLAGLSFFLIFFSIIIFSIYNGVSFIRNLLSSSDELRIFLLSFDLLKDLNFEQILTSAGVSQLLNFIQILILLMPNAIINIIIFFIFLFYFIKYGEDILLIIRGVIPPAELRLFDSFIEKINLVMKSLFSAQFLTPFIEAIVIFIFLVIMKIPFSFELAFFSFLMGFLNITSMIVPLGLNAYYFYLGVQTNNYVLFFISLGLSIFIFLVDDFIKPFIGKKIANTNPILFILGLFGGIHTLGFTGFIVGPLITTSLQLLYEINFEKKRIY